MLKTHQHVGGVIYEEIYQQKCQILKKKKTPKKTKKRKLMLRTTHQHAEEVTYKV